MNDQSREVPRTEDKSSRQYGDAFEFWWSGTTGPGLPAQFKEIAWESWKASAYRSVEEIDKYKQVCAAAYQLAGTVGAPVRFLDALGDAANGEIGARTDPEKLLPVDLTECDECVQPPPATTGATPRTDASEAISPYPKFVLAADMRKCERERDDARRELAESERNRREENAALSHELAVWKAAQPPSAAAPSDELLERMVEAYTGYQRPTDRGLAQQIEGMRLAVALLSAPTGDAESAATGDGAKR